MGNYSIPFIAQGVFGQRGFLFFLFLLVSFYLLPGVESLRRWYNACTGIRKRRRRRKGRGGDKTQVKYTSFSLSFCVLSCLLSFCWTLRLKCRKPAQVGKEKKRYLILYIVASNCKTLSMIQLLYCCQWGSNGYFWAWLVMPVKQCDNRTDVLWLHHLDM